MNTVLGKIDTLIDLAEKTLEVTPSDHETYLERLDHYVESFGTWQATLKLDSFDTLPKDAQDKLRSALEGLLELHESVITRATTEKDSVQQQLLDTRKRIQGLRAYLDKLPSRITVAGKRQG